MSVTLERGPDGRILVRDPVRKQMADLMAAIPATHRARVRQLLDLERQVADRTRVQRERN